MKITYIYPNMFQRTDASDVMQPLSIAALAAQTPENWEIRFYDDRIEKIDFEKETDLAVLSFLTFSAKRAYNIASEYKKRGVVTILGGFHPTLLPMEAAEHGDSVVTGDAENIWPDVLEDAALGRLQRHYDAGPCSNSRDIRYDRSVFVGKKYLPMLPVQLSRGCKYSCDFCSIHSVYNSKTISRPIDIVIKEINGLKEKILMFIDDNLFVDEKIILPFLTELKGLQKKWSCQISIDAAYNTKLLRKLHDAGCMAVLVGFESMELENLKSMRKGVNIRNRNYEDVVKRFRDSGLMICGTFVFGYDGDDEDSIEKTLEFALKNKFALCHFNTLYPFPKTQVYNRLKEEGRLLYDCWWMDESFSYGDPMFKPKNIESQRLGELCFEAKTKFNSYGNIARRAFDFKTNARTPYQFSSFLISNLISRREIIKKQGGKLG